jgi:REP element-mobilizing transposase RayT
MLAGWNKGLLQLSPIGEIAKKYWMEIPMHYPNTVIDEFIIMPEHIHGILVIWDNNDGENIVVTRHGPINKDVVCQNTVRVRHDLMNKDVVCQNTVRVRHGLINKDVVCQNTVRVRHGEPLQKTSVQTNRVPNHGNPLQRNQYQQIIPKSLGIIINQFKSTVKRWCNENGFSQFKWQRNFFEHIIRDENALYKIRSYIRNNPAALMDCFPGLRVFK